MAVYERTYRRYAGPMTPPWSRFLVVPRYVFRDLVQSKLVIFLYALCFLFPLLCALAIWFRNSEALLALFGAQGMDPPAIGGDVFRAFMLIQGTFAFFITLVVGPGLVSRDLANNGLPLYLSRPLWRGEYVVGKLSVLAVVLSLITWIPGLALYALQSGLDKGDWMTEHVRDGVGMFIGFWVWILLLALLMLALSAWLKWRPVAAFMMMVLFAAGSIFAQIVNALFRTAWGHLVNPGQLMVIVWSSLVGVELPPGPPVWMAWLSLMALAGVALFLLDRKLCAYEVVK